MARKLNYENRHIMLNYLYKRVEEDGRPLAIVITDPAGRVVESVQMDGAPIRMMHFAYIKAYTAALFEKPTAEMREHLAKGGSSMAQFCDPNLTILRGGAPIFDKEGELIGAIGMSGWKSEEDQELSSAAAALLKTV